MGRVRDELPHRHWADLTVPPPGASAKLSVLKTELDGAVRYTEPSHASRCFSKPTSLALCIAG